MVARRESQELLEMSTGFLLEKQAFWPEPVFLFSIFSTFHELVLPSGATGQSPKGFLRVFWRKMRNVVSAAGALGFPVGSGGGADCAAASAAACRTRRRSAQALDVKIGGGEF